jgi:nucleoside-triphosphatase THEP1
MGRSPRAAILTGERGAGKTSLCQELAQDRQRFAGVVSPPLFDGEGRKVGFSAHCLSTGARWELGRSDAPLDGPVFGKYSFSADGIARALECLRGALARRDAVVVVDEIGPLEIEKRVGLFPILSLLTGSGDLIVVTRPGLVERVAGYLPHHAKEVFLLHPGARADLTLRIRGFILSSNL